MGLKAGFLEEKSQYAKPEEEEVDDARQGSDGQQWFPLQI
jgi:hypothetical protein